MSKQSLVNDIHSELNVTRVRETVQPTSVEELKQIITRAHASHVSISIAGGRHAMGSQQFGTGTILIDMTRMDKIIAFDKKRGHLTVEAGIEWPAILEYLHETQKDDTPGWAVVQKQTGADNLTIGGALSANVHGRGLTFGPFIQDVESFWLLTADGEHRECSRTTQAELFSLVIGGYGLFGVITRVTLRLMPRHTLQRIVESIGVDDLSRRFAERITDGFLFGDFQFNTDRTSDTFLTHGVFSCYKSAPQGAVETTPHKQLSPEDWAKFFTLGHTDQKKAYEMYTQYYLSTSGQLYDSDAHQKSYYPEGYHTAIDAVMKTGTKATEMITEIYVPRDEISPFLHEVAQHFRKTSVDVFYGTVRLIEPDRESFLAWATKPYICIIFNLHVVHTSAGIAKAKEAFRYLIDVAIHRGGRYYLTYHTWARKDQVLACYPQFPAFLKKKKEYDPTELFQSNWYRLYKRMFGRPAWVPVVLWILTALFTSRVLGQLFVAAYAPTFLPPFDSWHSGIMPYSALLAAQLLLIAGMSTIAHDMQRNTGYFAETKRWFQTPTLIFGLIYLVAMIGRCAWFGLSIMVVFHWVLAGFILVFAFSHRHYADR